MTRHDAGDHRLQGVRLTFDATRLSPLFLAEAYACLVPQWQGQPVRAADRAGHAEQAARAGAWRRAGEGGRERCGHG
jgi:hypothetical protein